MSRISRSRYIFPERNKITHCKLYGVNFLLLSAICLTDTWLKKIFTKSRKQYFECTANKSTASNFNNHLHNIRMRLYFTLHCLASAAVIILIEYYPWNDIQLLMHQSEELIRVIKPIRTRHNRIFINRIRSNIYILRNLNQLS